MKFAVIPILGSLFNFMLDNLTTMAGGTGALLITIIGWLTRKYVVPYLNVERKRRYARYISAIADEITDELVVKYPDKNWAKYLDEAVDKIIGICQINSDIARRAAVAAISRKKNH